MYAHIIRILHETQQKIMLGWRVCRKGGDHKIQDKITEISSKKESGMWRTR